MNEIEYTIKVKVSTEQKVESEVADMIGTALAEGAEANMDGGTKITDLEFSYVSKIEGSKKFSFEDFEDTEDEDSTEIGGDNLL